MKTSDKISNSALPSLKVGFNEEWEARNWYETIYGKARYGLRSGGDRWNLGDIPADLPGDLEKTHTRDEAIALIEKRIAKEMKKPAVEQLVKASIRKARSRWRQVASKFFPILSAMLDVPIGQFEPYYHAYFTLSTRAPFGADAFMFNRFLDFADLAMHEIMHIEFLKSYAEYCKKKDLDQEKLEHLKEILTVLLNEDAGHLLTRPDPGYTKHLSIRPKVLKLYRQSGGREGEFRTFLDKAIELVRQSDF